MVTDGRSKSFAIFTYECNLTEWSGLGPIYVEIGDGRKVQHYLSGSERANEIDCNSQPNLTEVNLLFDLVDPTSISLPTRPPSIPPPATSFNPTVPITTFEGVCLLLGPLHVILWGVYYYTCMCLSVSYFSLLIIPVRMFMCEYDVL